MNKTIKDRILLHAEYITANSATVRETASVFGISKSTVHADVTKRLKTLDKELFERVASVLAVNLAERHIRGGESTRIKYLKENSSPPSV